MENFRENFYRAVTNVSTILTQFHDDKFRTKQSLNKNY